LLPSLLEDLPVEPGADSLFAAPPLLGVEDSFAGAVSFGGLAADDDFDPERLSVL
jgi:hypothetical protein